MSSHRVAFIAARLVAASFLVWAISRHPIGYYAGLKVGVCALCLYATVLAVQQKRLAWAITFGAFAVVFNPFVSVRLTRETWAYVDLFTAGCLIASTFLFNDTRSNDA